MEVFTVIAHRWGDDENHSYFVGTYSDEALADEMALAEEHWRGGKYTCKVSSSILDEIDHEVLNNYRTEVKGLEPMTEGLECKTHPDAPHGFNRNSSFAEGRYVCDCENWEPEVETLNPNIVDDNDGNI